MTAPPPILRLLLAILCSFALAPVPGAPAIDAGDMDPHLPDEAILAAMRFRAFTRKAEDQKVWEKEHARLLESLNAQLEAASLSDIRSATALRTLIEDLGFARFVPPNKLAKKNQNEYPVLPNGNRVMVKQEFHIDKAESRVITYPFEITSVPALITVGIGSGGDDSGDHGLHFLLIDPVGRVIKRGFSDIEDFVWEEHQCTRPGTWKLIIEDLDTDLNDKTSPGNHGSVEVLAKPD